MEGGAWPSDTTVAPPVSGFGRCAAGRGGLERPLASAFCPRKEEEDSQYEAPEAETDRQAVRGRKEEDPSEQRQSAGQWIEPHPVRSREVRAMLAEEDDGADLA